MNKINKSNVSEVSNLDNLEYVLVYDKGSNEPRKANKSAFDATIAGSSPSVYASNLTQSGTSAPTEAVISDNSGAISISWAYTSAGAYTGTVTGLTLTAGKTQFFIGGGDLGEIANIRRLSDTQVQVTTIYNNSVSGDNNILNNSPIKIEVYP